MADTGQGLSCSENETGVAPAHFLRLSAASHMFFDIFERLHVSKPVILATIKIGQILGAFAECSLAFYI